MCVGRPFIVIHPIRPKRKNTHTILRWFSFIKVQQHYNTSIRVKNRLGKGNNARLPKCKCTAGSMWMRKSVQNRHSAIHWLSLPGAKAAPTSISYIKSWQYRYWIIHWFIQFYWIGCSNTKFVTILWISHYGSKQAEH